MTDEAWMLEALVLAREAGSEGEVPVGAIVVCGGVAEYRVEIKADRALPELTMHVEAEEPAVVQRLESKLGKRVKKTSKGLVRAEERLITLADARFKDVGKGLKKARKSLRKVFS